MSLAHFLETIFFPERCPLCARLVEEGEGLCKECRRERPACESYLLPPNPNRPDLFCVRAPYLYCGSPRRGVMALKFFRHRPASRVLAEAIAGLPQVSGLGQADFVTSVPLSRARLRQRGYNQSELIARQFALIKGLPYRETLYRSGNADKQSLQAGKKSREKNVRAAFESLAPVSGTVVLIDDVYTTGQTMRACARALRRAGAQRVIGLAACSARFQKKKA